MSSPNDERKAILDQIETVKNLLSLAESDPPGITQTEHEQLEKDLQYWRDELQKFEGNVAETCPECGTPIQVTNSPETHEVIYTCTCGCESSDSYIDLHGSMSAPHGHV